MSRWKVWSRLIPLTVGMALLLSGCSLMGVEPNPLDPKGSVAKDQLFQIKFSLGIMFAVLLVVFALFFYVIIRFRKRRGTDIVPKQVEGNHLLEAVWTIIPIFLIVAIAIPTVYYTFKFSKDYSEYKDAVQVNVTAHHYWWEFEYTDYDITTAQELYIPVDTKVYVQMESRDVIHSFWVPALAGKLDVMPGIVNKMYFDADEPGVYRGKCAELCGPDHAFMDFKVHAVSQEEFDAWIANMQKPAASVAAEVEEGAELFKNACMSCHATDVQTKALGPNLTNFANREYIAGYLENTPENLHAWIKNPFEFKEDSRMPVRPLSDADITKIVDYLETLK